MPTELETFPFTAATVGWAYRRGIFPMGFDDGSVGWFQPSSRALLLPQNFRTTRSLLRSSKRFEVRHDQEFAEIMKQCADRAGGFWISQEFIRVYTELFDAGNGGCCGTYLDGELVGGVYGARFGNAFMAESMFHRVSDAGKVALWELLKRLESEGVTLVDVQYMTPHLRSLGATEVSHAEYLRLLKVALS